MASGESSTSDSALFLKPDPIRLVYDPWVDATWLGGDFGLFLRQEGTPGLKHYNIRQGLPSTFIYDLFPTASGVWVASSGGPGFLSKSTQSVSIPTFPDGKKLGVESRTVFAEGATAWVGTTRNGLYRIEGQPPTLTEVKNPVNGSSFTEPILGIRADGPVLFLSVAGYGLIEWNRATGDADLYKVNLLEDRPLYGRISVGPHDVWIATSGDGVVKYNRTSHQMLEYAGPTNVNALTIYSVTRSGSEVWFATQAGVSRYDQATDAWRYWQSGSGMEWGSGNDVALIEGNIYALTTRGTVLLFDRSLQTWMPAEWWSDSDAPRFNTVVDCDRDGSRLLFSTAGGGANYYDPATSKWSVVGEEPGDQGRLNDILAWTADSDAKQRWFGTEKGLNWVDRSTGAWHKHRTYGSQDELIGNPIRDVIVTPDTVWAATSTGKVKRASGVEWNPGNVAKFDRAAQTWTYFDTSDGLSGENVTKLAVDGDRLWIGITDTALDVLDIPTGQIRRVFPSGTTKDGILSILARPDAIWVGTVVNGLVRIDPNTLAAQPVPALAGIGVTALVWHDGVIWGGTSGRGLFKYDPATQQRTDYRSGGGVDAWIHCLLYDGDRIYAGTQWGIERFDPTAGRWFPQTGRFLQEAAPPPQVPQLQITGPLAGSRWQSPSPLTVMGTTSGSTTGRIEVQVGAGPWGTADGLGSWTLNVPSSDEYGGSTMVTARLMEGSRVVAQGAVEIFVGSAAQEAAAAQPDATRLDHQPVLQALVGDSMRLSLQSTPMDHNVRATAYVRRVGGSEFEPVPFASMTGGRYDAEIPMGKVPGIAQYYVVASVSGGLVRFPEPFSEYGDKYDVFVRALPGGAIALIVGQENRIEAAPGARATLAFSLQNTGTLASTFTTTLDGSAAHWVVNAPPPLPLGPGTTQNLTLQVQVPAGTTPGDYTLRVGMAPGQGEGTGYAADFTVVVSEKPAGEGGGTKAGTPSLPWAAAVLVALFVAVRRHR